MISRQLDRVLNRGSPKQKWCQWAEEQKKKGIDKLVPGIGMFLERRRVVHECAVRGDGERHLRTIDDQLKVRRSDIAPLKIVTPSRLKNDIQ